MSERVKVLILGPSKTGKSNIANFLSGNKETPTSEYKETCPLRLFEVQVDGRGKGANRHIRIDVEIWDCSGNTKYQQCWPAMWKNADAIIFVVNPEIPNQEKELELWHKSFAVPAKIPEKHCLVFAHHSTPPDNAVGVNAIPPLPKCVANCRALETSLDFTSDSFKEAFEGLISTVIASRREAEENALIRDDGMSGPLLVGASQ